MMSTIFQSEGTIDLLLSFQWRPYDATGNQYILKDFKNASPYCFSFLVNGIKIEPTHVDYLCSDQMMSERDLNLISNCRVISDNVTLVKLLSSEFMNRLFMISIWIFIDYVPIMIANSYRLKHFPCRAGPVASIL